MRSRRRGMGGGGKDDCLGNRDWEDQGKEGCRGEEWDGKGA